MTTNIYLNSVLFPISKYYGGTFSANNIPSTTQEASFIVNLSLTGEIGTHFVCVIIKKTFLYYFDSFGEPCYNEHINNYMVQYNRPIYHNAIRIQHDKSKFCGFFCMLQVLLSDDKHYNFSLRFFTTQDNLWKNDRLCVQYIKSIIGK